MSVLFPHLNGFYFAIRVLRDICQRAVEHASFGFGWVAIGTDRSPTCPFFVILFYL